MLRRFKAAGIPVVAVFLSGRPLWVNAEINASDAFVAAFCRAAKGRVADLLFADTAGKPRHDFRGKSFSWPKQPDQYVLNRRDAGYDPLFAFGYGLSYAKPGKVAHLDRNTPAGMAETVPGTFYGRGQPAAGRSRRRAYGAIGRRPPRTGGQPPLRLERARAGRLCRAASVDLSRESNGEINLVVDYRVEAKPARTVTAGLQKTGRPSNCRSPACWRRPTRRMGADHHPVAMLRQTGSGHA